MPTRAITPSGKPRPICIPAAKALIPSPSCNLATTPRASTRSLSAGKATGSSRRPPARLCGSARESRRLRTAMTGGAGMTGPANASLPLAELRARYLQDQRLSHRPGQHLGRLRALLTLLHLRPHRHRRSHRRRHCPRGQRLALARVRLRSDSAVERDGRALHAALGPNTVRRRATTSANAR